ncbi:MAG: hypothetical protein HKN91_01470, partial [Acidimicrobiia bacterium]|nr:hypothetical protein [Acidimicrobiia bacterium]
MIVVQQMRRFGAGFAALALVASSCGGEDITATTEALSTTTPGPSVATSTSVPEVSTTTAAAPTTTTTEAPPPSFALDFRPVLGPGEPVWDSNFLVPGALIDVDGLLHLFYNGHDIQGTSATRAAIGLATSDDGKFFGRVLDEPLFDAAERAWTDAGIVVSSGLILEDGTWALYFHTVSRPFSQRGGVIGRATAERAEGPWIVDPEPLLELGSEGEWDGSGLSHPSVVRAADGSFVMYYDAHIRDEDVNPDRFIGLATSPDGATWTKHDDPATAEAPFAESDPIFGVGAEGEWDALRVQHPSVIETTDGYAMLYMSNHKGAQPGLVWEWGIATSADGMSWERSDGDPFWTTKGVFGFITSSGFIEFKGEWIMLVDAAGSITTP